MTEVLVKEGTTETDQELCDLMQEAIGYSLTNDTKLEAMFWLSGEGGNGKTVLVETLKRLVGDMAAKINFSTLGQQGNYSLANVPGKRILFSTESKRGGGAAEEYIKQIVSGEVIDARAIYGRPFEFTAVGKIWWAMNDKPTIKDTGNSVWRRLLLIPFNRTFGEQDKDIFLRDTLNQELSGILNFAINGLKRLRQNCAFTKSTAVQQAINQYKHETNPVKQWLDENTEPTKDAISSSKLLYTDYEAWCEDNGRKALNSVHFGIELSKLKVKDKKATAGKLFAVKLINPTPHTVKRIWNGVVQHYAAVEGM